MNLLFISPDPVRRSLIKTVATNRFPTLSCNTRRTLPPSFDPYDVVVLPSEVFPLPDDALSDSRVLAYGPLESLPHAFLQGCVDYLVEPWQPEELFYRALRFGPAEQIRFRGWVLPVFPGGIRTPKRTIPLTAIEYTLLVTLIRAKGRIVPRSVLERSIPGPFPHPSSRRIDAHMSRLRKKLLHCLADLVEEARTSQAFPAPLPASFIRSSRGSGYYLITD
ncbi:MAG: hypothetical protein Kow009_01310 [Spirochaetales bacterium]